MKTTVTHAFLVICLCFFIVSCSDSPQEKIIGEWKGKDSCGKVASFIFDADNNAKLIIGNRVADEKTAGAKIIWKLDTSHDPMHLDLIITPPTGEKRIIPLIIRFLTDSKIQLRGSDDIKSRPITFSASDDKHQIILMKQ